MPSFRPLLLASILTLAFSSVSLAQVTGVNDQTTTPVPGAGHDYIHMLSETVNPATGTVSVRIQFPTPKGRGITLPFSIDYDSGSVNHLVGGIGGAGFSAELGTMEQGGWSYSAPGLAGTYTTVPNDPYNCTISFGCQYSYCDITSNYEFRDASGGLHPLGLGAVLDDMQNDPNNPQCPQGSYPTGGDVGFSASYPPQNDGGPVTVSSMDGTVYHFESPDTATISDAVSEDAAPPDYIQDRNGNRITSTWNGVGTAFQFNFTDTVGRTVLSSNGFGPSGTTNTLAVGGLTYQVSWKTVSENWTTTANYVGSQGGAPGGNWACSLSGTDTTTQTVISQISLPNGRSFTFFYGSDTTPHGAPTNPFGLISEIDYPSGAWVQYTWEKSSSLNEVANFAGGQAIQDPQNGNLVGYSPVVDGCSYQYETPVLATRAVSYGGSTPVLTQNFSYPAMSWAPPSQIEYGTTVGSIYWTQKTTTVNAVDGVTGQETTTSYTYAPMLLPNSDPYSRSVIQTQTPVEQTVSYSDNSRTLRTVTKAWLDIADLFCQVTTLNDGNGQSRGTWYVYSNGDQLVDKREFDYGLITPSSCVAPAGSQGQQAALPSATPTRETVTTYQSFPTTAVGGTILDQPSTVKVYAGGTNGTLVSETDYTYDGGTPSVGNPTLVINKCLQSGSACAAGDLTTSYAYDSNGQVTSKTDGRGNITQYSYADDYNGLSNSYAACNGAAPTSGPTDAYLTQITYPSTNGVQHIVKFCYGYDDGQLRGSADQNGQVTIYKYNTPPSGCADSFDRLGEVDEPDGGKTTYCYNDAIPSITTSKLISSGVYLTSTGTFDGAGHQTESLLTSDPDCATGDRTDMTYDGLGRVHTTSNPYCSTSDPTYGVTKYTYDALGRTIQVTNPDNSTVITSYAGRATEVTDGSGKQRISQVDGLGRLTSACEVTSTTLSVGISGSTTPAPCGLDLSGTGFLTAYAYDGIDDLTGVTQGPLNPRSFTYNSLGELTSATNPESGQTTYTYDADSNLATKTDARGISITYSYDADDRLTGKTYSDSTPAVTYNYDQSSFRYSSILKNTIGRLSSESTAGSFSTLDAYSYDAMGRVKTNWQYGYDGATVMAASAPSYSYDLLGDVLGGLRSGTGTVTNTYNSAARLSGSTISYSNDSFGAPTTLISAPHYNALGELVSDLLGNGETETWGYDHRGRQVSYSDVEGSNTIYSYSLSYFPNGNVMSSNDSINGDWIYAYDDLNRLTSASFGGASYTYVYDRFGNRWEQNVVSGSGDMSNFAFDANNRIVGYTYDNAGDVIYDGIDSYTCDAEGHITTVPNLGTTFIYDAEGRRMAIYQPSYGSTAYRGRSLYLNGTDMAEGAAMQGRVRGEIYINGRHLLTIADLYSVFDHGDWLGSEHFRSYASNGTLYERCASNPFGDNLSCYDGPGFDMSPVHFAGKDRDALFGYDSPSPDNLDNFGARYYRSGAARFLSPDPDNAGADVSSPQSWNMYSYVANNPLTFTDPTGMECVWDDGSFDAEGDSQTGSVSNCQNAGGTWIELGQNGNWSGQANSDLQNLASSIQNGTTSSVTVTTADNSQYTTNYNSSGQVTQTITPDGSTIYGYGSTSSGPTHAGVGLAAVGGEGACIVMEPCGAGEATALNALVIGTVATVLGVDLYNHFAKGGTQNILPSWVTGRPLPGETAGEFARRVCTAHYGSVAGCGSGPGSEFNKIKKWAQEWIDKNE